MKTVVIPDIHHNIDDAQWILDNEGADEYVLLGDIFDDFHDTPHISCRTATWLVDTLQRDDVICLWGNHDVPYRWSMNKHVWCPGFDHDKCRAINSKMTFDHWDKLKWYYKTQGFYLSHAGLCEEIFCHPVNGFSDEYVDWSIDRGMNHLSAGYDADFCRHGFRMGKQRVGGLIWADWSELKPIKGINQIVGHSPAYETRVKYLRSDDKVVSGNYSVFERNKPIVNIYSMNYCVDTMLDQYLIIQDGEVNIKEHLGRRQKELERMKQSNSRAVDEY
jgi:hypothetical protein